MDYGRTALADRLAAEYVMGTLRGPARRRFEALLPAHPALRAAVAGWQARLSTLDESIVPVAPPPRVWRRIEQRLFTDTAAAPAGRRGWQRLDLWRAASLLATVAAVALGVALLQEPAARAPIVVVLAADPATGPADARFVASLSADGRALVLRPLRAPALTAAQALELWVVPAGGAPRSLGLVRADGDTTVLPTRLPRDAAALAVSIEPAGGSPTGAPTGPIVSVGRLRI